MRIRAVSYNVHGLRGGSDLVVAVLRRADADFVCLQECGSRRELRRLAEALEMKAVSSHRPFDRVRNAVLYRSPWRVAQFVVHDLSRERADRRGFVLARLRGHGTRVAVVSTHLGLSEPRRRQHAQELTDSLATLDRPVILGGDLNEGPGSPSARWMAERLFDAFGAAGDGAGETFPAAEPTERVDYVFVSEHLKALRAWVPDGEDARRASDHLPVVAELALE